MIVRLAFRFGSDSCITEGIQHLGERSCDSRMLDLEMVDRVLQPLKQCFRVFLGRIEELLYIRAEMSKHLTPFFVHGFCPFELIMKLL